jgi:hypothetical protein
VIPADFCLYVLEGQRTPDGDRFRWTCHCGHKGRWADNPSAARHTWIKHREITRTLLNESNKHKETAPCSRDTPTAPDG